MEKPPVPGTGDLRRFGRGLQMGKVEAPGPPSGGVTPT